MSSFKIGGSLSSFINKCDRGAYPAKTASKPVEANKGMPCRPATRKDTEAIKTALKASGIEGATITVGEDNSVEVAVSGRAQKNIKQITARVAETVASINHQVAFKVVLGD